MKTHLLSDCQAACPTSEALIVPCCSCMLEQHHYFGRALRVQGCNVDISLEFFQFNHKATRLSY